MMALRNRDLSILYRATGGLLATLLIVACALPDEAFRNYSAANRVSQWKSVLGAIAGGHARRAQRSDNRPL